MALERNKIFWSWHRKYISQFSFFHCSLYQVQNLKNLDTNLIKSIFITFVPVITLENIKFHQKLVRFKIYIFRMIKQFHNLNISRAIFQFQMNLQILKCKISRSKGFYYDNEQVFHLCWMYKRNQAETSSIIDMEIIFSLHLVK